MKPPKRITRVSKHRATQNQLYTKLKVKFLDEHPFCERCCDTIAPRFRDLHHHRGRSGRLLCWVPGWKMLCRGCHTWVHEHVKEAQKAGLIAGAGEWGVMPR